MPALVNVKAIGAGEEVILHVPPLDATPRNRARAKPEMSETKKSAKRLSSWLDRAQKEESLQRKLGHNSH